MSVTVNYKAPYTAAPTAVQQHYTPRNTVIADVVSTAAGDTTAVITHNFGLTAAELAQDYPSVTITPISDIGADAASPWFVAPGGKAANAVTLTKNTTDAGGTVSVAVSRVVGTPQQ